MTSTENWHGCYGARMGCRSADRASTGDFESLDKGRQVTQLFIDERRRHHLAVAGPVVRGLLLSHRSGVMFGSSAWYSRLVETLPQYSDVILTSVLKGLDVAVQQRDRVGRGRKLRRWHSVSSPSPKMVWAWAPSTMRSTLPSPMPVENSVRVGLIDEKHRRRRADPADQLKKAPSA